MNAWQYDPIVDTVGQSQAADAGIRSQQKATKKAPVRSARRRFFTARGMTIFMLICEMDKQANLKLLSRLHFGRLACASHNRPYIIPVHYAYENGLIYCSSTVGKKIVWMRENPLVCMEIDEIFTPQKWATVIIDGTYEELPRTPQFQSARARAHHLLEERPVWWEPGFAKTIIRGKAPPMEPLYFCIHVKEISGRQGIPDKELADRRG